MTQVKYRGQSTYELEDGVLKINGAIVEKNLRRLVGIDSCGKEVYQGDTIITPRKTFLWAWGSPINLRGHEMKIPLPGEKCDFTAGQLATIILNSVRKDF